MVSKMLAVSFKFFNIKKKFMGRQAALQELLETKMKDAEVIPDVIDEAPCQMLKVSYGDEVYVHPGDKLTPTQVQFPPCVSWKAKKNSCYTLCLTDPDAPSRKEPKFREWHHWLVGNIPGDHILKGDVLSEYIGSGPPKGTEFHRYVFLVYKQCKEIKFTEPRLTNRSGDNRGLFSIMKFAEKYSLEGPIAGNFFLAEYDAYVDKLYKKLSGK